MAKKGKEEPTPTINNVPNKDIIQRLNFMYQASAYLQSIQPQELPESLPEAPPNDAPVLGLNSRRKGKKRARNGTKKTMGDLARSYVKSMKVVGQRTTVKMLASPPLGQIFLEAEDLF
jgi:ribonuclease P protein subunit RPR2